MRDDGRAPDGNAGSSLNSRHSPKSVRGPRSPALLAGKVCSRIGLGAKRALHLALAGPRAIDVYRLCQIANALDVS